MPFSLRQVQVWEWTADCLISEGRKGSGMPTRRSGSWGSVSKNWPIRNGSRTILTWHGPFTATDCTFTVRPFPTGALNSFSGFQIPKYGSFVFTSNVDGQFQKAGFSEERIMECHGSIHHLQCIDNCQGMIWSADGTEVGISEDFRAYDPLPACPFCGAVARPNILMFNDYGWEYARTDGQRERLVKWMDTIEEEGGRLAIVEMGAGTAVPTVRNTSEQIAARFDVPLIRINPRESFGAEIALSMGAQEALQQIIGEIEQ